MGGCVCGGDGEACVCVGQCVSQLFVSVDVSGTFKVCGGILGGGGVKRVRAKCFDAAVVKCACVCVRAPFDLLTHLHFLTYPGLSLDNMAPDMEPLFEAICREVQAPVVKEDAPLQMLVSHARAYTHTHALKSSFGGGSLANDNGGVYTCAECLSVKGTEEDTCGILLPLTLLLRLSGFG